MNIYIYEVKKRWLPTFIWIIVLCFFSFVCFSMFEAIADQSLVNVMDDFPDAFKKAFGMDNDFTTILGYFVMISSFLFLSGAIFSCHLGFSIVSVEERDLTADFLIPKPLTRTKIITEKILAAVTHILIFDLLIGLVCYISIEIFKIGQEYSFNAFFLIMLGLLILQLLFFSMGLLISVSLKRMDSPLPLSLGISFGFYILNAFDMIIEDTFIKYLVPYDYFDPGYILENEAFKTYGLITGIVLILLFTVLSYMLYKKRNIKTAM